MHTVQVYLAYLLSILQIKLGFSISERKMAMLLRELRGHERYKLLAAYYNTKQPIQNIARKTAMTSFLLDPKRVQDWRFDIGLIAIIVSVLAERDNAINYISPNTWVNIIEHHNASANMRVMYGKKGIRSKLVLFCNGDLIKMLTLLKAGTRAIPSRKVAVSELCRIIDGLVRDNNFPTDTILEALISPKQYLCDDEHLEDRLVYVVCRYGKPEQIKRLAEKRTDKIQRINYYSSRYSKKQPTAKRRPWRQ
jgi:hypothetical protein